MAEEKSDDNPLEEAAADLSSDLEGKRVDLEDSAVGVVQGGHVAMRDSAARSVRAQALNMSDSAAGFVLTKSLDMREAAIGFAASEQVTVQSGNIGLLASGRLKAEELCTWLVVAGKVEGNVNTKFSLLSALALGAGFGLIVMLFRSFFTRNRGRKLKGQDGTQN